MEQFVSMLDPATMLEMIDERLYAAEVLERRVWSFEGGTSDQVNEVASVKRDDHDRVREALADGDGDRLDVDADCLRSWAILRPGQLSAASVLVTPRPGAWALAFYDLLLGSSSLLRDEEMIIPIPIKVYQAAQRMKNPTVVSLWSDGRWVFGCGDGTVTCSWYEKSVASRICESICLAEESQQFQSCRLTLDDLRKISTGLRVSLINGISGPLFNRFLPGEPSFKFITLRRVFEALGDEVIKASVGRGGEPSFFVTRDKFAALLPLPQEIT